MPRPPPKHPKAAADKHRQRRQRAEGAKPIGMLRLTDLEREALIYERALPPHGFTRHDTLDAVRALLAKIARRYRDAEITRDWIVEAEREVAAKVEKQAYVQSSVTDILPDK